MKRLSNEEWKNIFTNLQEMDESDYYDGEVSWVEIHWLEGTNEYVLCYGEELFEDGFESEKEAQDRLNSLEQLLLGNKLNIIGYFRESTELIDTESRNFNEKSLYIVVYENSTVDGEKTWLEGYNVIEGHFEIKDKAYLISCEKITKEQYIEATKGWYTPPEYIQ